jgi:hypothetical protein
LAAATPQPNVSPNRAVVTSKLSNFNGAPSPKAPEGPVGRNFSLADRAEWNKVNFGQHRVPRRGKEMSRRRDK